MTTLTPNIEILRIFFLAVIVPIVIGLGVALIASRYSGEKDKLNGHQ